MGFGLTLKKMLEHFISEPDMIISSIAPSMKDIIEILYFYFTELSLTACYVILFILAARYLLRKAPKIYSYSLWGVVYFKLVAAFKFDFWKHSFIPQAQIDKIYQNITPDYTAFYSTEAGVVSIVQSEMVTSPSITPVTPMYIPAFIWFIGVVVLFCVTFGAFVHIIRHTAGTKQKLYDNVYVCKYITAPFVFGIIRPKIYLPDGLTEQQQKYVITHEKVHIKRGDHIVKLFAYGITCLHWFNPLVWLSFFLFEKDMEMSCDEKVLQILGNEHKKDYSYCILSLATSKKFVPKAYLSFGDSDTKKRVKNVLNYKKPAVIASAMIIIGIAVIAFGMFAKGEYMLPPQETTPDGSSSAYVTPNGYDRFNLTLDGYNTSVSFVLPYGWSIENRNIRIGTEPPYITLDDNFSDVFDIYDDNRNNVGAFGFLSYTEQLGAENNLVAIYGAITLPNMYKFDVTDEYTVVNRNDSGTWETATTKVYHSPSLVHNNGGLGDAVYGDGILSYSRECTDFVAFEFEENLFSKDELNLIARSVQIEPAQTSYSIGSTLVYTHYRNMDTGSSFDVSKYVSEDVLKLLNAKSEIEKHRLQVFGNNKQSYDISVIPFERDKWIENAKSAEIKLQVVRTWRYITANFDSSASDVISLRFDRNTAGDLVVTQYRIEGKDTTFANMDADYWNAVADGSGDEFLDEFVNEYKSFISNSASGITDTQSTIISVQCAEQSDFNKYVITYCDDKIVSESGTLCLTNINDFDITVHLIGDGNETTVDIAKGATSFIYSLQKGLEYTIGIHSDVEMNTEINLTIFEAY